MIELTLIRRLYWTLNEHQFYCHHTLLCSSRTHSQRVYSVAMCWSSRLGVYTRRTANLVLGDLVRGLCGVYSSYSYQSDDGALGGELSSAEQRPDESVDEFVFRVCARVVIRNLLPLQDVSV